MLLNFLAANLDKKRDHFDLAFAGSAFHILAPFEFAKTIDGLFQVMKEGGKLFLIQHANHQGKYHQDYIENVQRGELWPFWVKVGTQLEFYSDPETTKKLLNDFGFEVEHINLYLDNYIRSNISFRYVGAIARKKGLLRNEERVSQYHTRAMEKIRETVPARKLKL